MTDNNKTALEENGKVPEAPKEDTRSGAQKAKDRKHSEKLSSEQNNALSTANKTLLSAAIAISIVALASSGWLYYQAQNTNAAAQLSQLKTKQNEINNQLNAYNQSRAQITQLSEQVSDTEQNIKQQTNGLINQQNQQSTQIRKIESQLSRLNNTTKEDWKLAEAEYLVRLANQRILLESDVKGSAGLLASADSILAELEDPMFFDARKAIAKDIQTLKSTRHFDLQGRYLQLDALYDQVNQLPQREPSKAWQQSNQSNTPNQTNTVANKVTSVLGDMWQSLKSLVIINYNHKPIKALLPPTEYQQLVTGLQLQIDVAQVAMVKGEAAIYQKALSRVANAVTEHFDTKSQSVIAFLSSITSLQQVNPAPELPLPHDSLEAMKKLMAAWNERALSTETKQTTPSTTQETSDKSKTMAPEPVTPQANSKDEKQTAPSNNIQGDNA